MLGIQAMHATDPSGAPAAILARMDRFVVPLLGQSALDINNKIVAGEYVYLNGALVDAADTSKVIMTAAQGQQLQDYLTNSSREALHKSPTHVLAHACRVRQHPGPCNKLISA